MIRVLLTRELIVAARRAATPLTVCIVAALLTGFVLVWWPGVAILAPLSLYEQTRILHWMVIAAALPWVAVRSASRDHGDSFVLMAALAGAPPASVVAGKILSTFVVLALVIFAGLPPLLVAQQAAAIPFAAVVRDLVPCLGLAFLVATSSTASTLIFRDSVLSWLATTTLTAAVLIAAASWLSGTAAIGALCTLVGAVGSVLVCHWSNGALRYLDDASAA
jgi:hypothetical protein